MVEPGKPTHWDPRDPSKCQSREWCWTLNNPSKRQFRELRRVRPSSDKAGVTYHVFQVEVAATGTEHLQGYTIFNSSKRFDTVKKWFLGHGEAKPHLSTRYKKSSPAAASGYCKDPKKRHPLYGDFLCEVGSIPDDLGRGQGFRSDLAEVKARLDSGETPSAVAADERHFGTAIRNYRALQWYSHATTVPRTKAPSVCVLWGADSGTGKSSWSLAGFRPGECYYLPTGSSGGSWFSDYDPLVHKVLVVEEMCGSVAPLGEILKWCNKHPLTVNTKGGHVQFKFEFIVFTSNYEPRNWYDFWSENSKLRPQWPALERRMKNVWCYSKEAPYPVDLGRLPTIPWSYALLCSGGSTKHPRWRDLVHIEGPLYCVPEAPGEQDVEIEEW